MCRGAGVWERGAQERIEYQEIAKEVLEAGWPCMVVTCLLMIDLKVLLYLEKI